MDKLIVESDRSCLAGPESSHLQETTMNQAFYIVFILCGSGLTSTAAELSAVPTGISYTISLDGQSPKSVQVTIPWPAKDNDPVSNPKAPYLVRARDFQTELTKLFGNRVSLAEIDLRNHPGKVEYGLRVTAGPAEGLKNLKGLSGKLLENELIAAVQAGARRTAGALDDECLTQIAEVGSTRRLRLYECRLTSAVWPSIAKLKQLEELTITAAEISGDKMSNIATLMKLKSITLNDTNITDTDLAHFSKLDRMEFIELYRCRKVGDAGVKAFGGLSSLTHLNLSDTKVGDTGLEHLSRLTKLEELSLANTAITDAGLVHLSAMRKMHLLVLDGTAVNGSGLGALTKMPNMSQLQLMNSQLTGENWMKFVPKMESYDRGLMFLSKGSKITPEEAQKIRKLSKGQAFIN